MTMYDERKKCYLCDSFDHVYCGVCASCGEHTFFRRPEGAEDDVTEPAISECCGANGNAYDADAASWLEDRDSSGGFGYLDNELGG